MAFNIHMDKLFQYALGHQFEEFDRLFTELEGESASPVFWEAYLMRAQIKLYASDPTALDDLEMADKAGSQRQYRCLGALWQADAPNRFFIFSQKPGGVGRFRQTLPQVRERMARWYGEQGDVMVRQIQSNVQYFLGSVREALAIAEEPLSVEYANYTDILMLLSMRFRCHLALGDAEKAEHSILEIIRLAKAYPECLAPYMALRGWANATTRWNSESPWDYENATGEKQPALEDRLEYIRLGSAQTTPLEAPFEMYANQHYEEAYSLRQHYMDIFHAIYWLSVGDRRQAKSYFQTVHKTALASGITMPLIECGEQILPLLQFAEVACEECPRDWLTGPYAKAVGYEAGLAAYRNEIEGA